jgi:hypothetical protein
VNSAGTGLPLVPGGHSLLKRKVFQFGFTAGIILLFYLGVKKRFFCELPHEEILLAQSLPLMPGRALPFVKGRK